jgi:hypothetical protein
MQIMKFATHDDQTSHIGVVHGDQLIPIGHGERALSELLHASDTAATLQGLLASPQRPVAISSVRVLAPIDDQEVWGYLLRSRIQGSSTGTLLQGDSQQGCGPGAGDPSAARLGLVRTRA